MLEKYNHSGYINIGRNYECVKAKKQVLSQAMTEGGVDHPTLKLVRHYAYDYADGEVVIHAFERIPEIDGQNFVLGNGFDDTNYLFYSQLPVDMSELSFYPQNYPWKIDFAVKGYMQGSKYTEAIFDFDELQYFCPSSSVLKDDNERNVVFSGKSTEVKAFNIELDSVKCHVRFIIGAKGKLGIAHSNMEAITEIHISFPETDDFGFLNKIYLLVDLVFAFICNRRNTTCLSMRLGGKYPAKAIDNRKIVDCERSYVNCEIFFYNKYREEPEGKKVISKTWDVNGFFVHIDKLFEMVASDISDDGEGGGTISIASVHPSVKRRNLVDLQQTLQITGAFEFYVRKYLPNMTPEENHHTVMRMILEEVAEKSKGKFGKLRKLALSMANHVISEPGLEDKLMKAYRGYSGWNSLKPCIDDNWFKEDEIETLGHEVNLWRNELAHTKRSYEPKVETIRAVGLLEHLNYAIVLRKLGYNDEEIKNLLEQALKRIG